MEESLFVGIGEYFGAVDGFSTFLFVGYAAICGCKDRVCSGHGPATSGTKRVRIGEDVRLEGVPVRLAHEGVSDGRHGFQSFGLMTFFVKVLRLV